MWIGHRKEIRKLSTFRALALKNEQKREQQKHYEN